MQLIDCFRGVQIDNQTIFREQLHHVKVGNLATDADCARAFNRETRCAQRQHKRVFIDRCLELSSKPMPDSSRATDIPLRRGVAAPVVAIGADQCQVRLPAFAVTTDHRNLDDPFLPNIPAVAAPSPTPCRHTI